MEKKNIFSGILWSAIETFFNAGFRTFLTFFLAKMLLPKDFGLIGMTMVFITVITAISDLGIASALIQKKNDLKAEEMYNTSFWTGLINGIFLYVILVFFLSSFISDFYEEPFIKKILPFLCIPILVKPLNIINVVILSRKLNFKTIALYNNLSTFISGIIAITAAIYDYGVWSLVLFNVLSVTISVPFFYIKTRWMPSIVWNNKHFHEVFKFGMFAAGSAFMGAITYNLDNLMIGKFIGANALGGYTLAFSLTEIIRQKISRIMNTSMFPVFGKTQDNVELSKKYFITTIKGNAILIYPIMSYLFFFGEPIVLFFFGGKWQSAILPMRVLSIAVMIHLTVNSFTTLLRGLGYPNIEFKILVFLTFFILLPSLYTGIMFYGIEGAVFAIIINKIVLVIIAAYVLKNKIKLNYFTDILYNLKGVLLVMFFSYSFVFFFNKLITVTELFQIVIYSVLLFAGVFVLEKKFINDLKSKIFKR